MIFTNVELKIIINICPLNNIKNKLKLKYCLKKGEKLYN
jgi:hypothetical protein